jgi:cytochrome c oxidase assembly protein subunit 15
MQINAHLDEPVAARPVAFWLLICAAMIAVMVVVGGLTRLTHSGLSIVEWKPLMGVLPPLSAAEWEEAFRQYQQYPEYQKLNSTMTLEGFKEIFWLEFIHRLWGRAIGLVFLIPLVYFIGSGRISARLVPKLIGIFVLGGLQGVMGWYMVKSGLIDRPDVSQYRLTAHLGLAFVIYGYIFWTAFGLLFPHALNENDPGLRRMALVVLLLTAATVLAGGFVAGLDAGFTYNTFPLMGGKLIPDGLFLLDPWFKNFFENVTTVQFTHRALAIATGVGCLVLWWRARKRELAPRTRLVIHGALATSLVQIALGISTVVLAVPLSLAAAHQAGALVVFTFIVWTLHELRACE